MAKAVGRRDVLRAGLAGAGAWLGGLRVADLVGAAPASDLERFVPRVQTQPSNDDDLAYLTIAEASALIASRQITPIDLVRACVRRIETLDPVIKAYVATYADEAMAQAQAATAEIHANGPRSPLHGIPIAHKDLYDIAGRPTRAGSRVRADAPAASEDATVVARLRDAGAIVLGKTNTHEFAFGVWTPPTSNPWDPTRVPGGSSGGSAAALASGMILGTTGSDTGGSIRIPASLCNTVGIKPTYGRASRAGVVPLAFTLDHTGPICRSVEDAALMLQTIAGPDPRDPTTARAPVPDFSAGLTADGARGKRIGVPTSVFFDGADPETTARVLAAAATLEGLGAQVVELPMPPTQYPSATAYLAIQLSEPLAAHEPYLRTRAHDYQTQTQVLFALGAEWTAQHYLRAQRLRTINIREWLAIFDHVDAVLTPATPRPAPTKQEAEMSGVFDLVNYTSFFDFNGCPSISVPAGFTTAGLPVGAMLSARPFAEQTILQIAYAYQEATGFYRARPPLASA